MSSDGEDSTTPLRTRIYSAIYETFAEIDNPWWIDHYVEKSVARVLAVLDDRRPSADELASPASPNVYLSRRDVAERIGVSPDSLSRYALPHPDVMVGRTRAWLPATIDAWNSTRPGRGARTDLKGC